VTVTVDVWMNRDVRTEKYDLEIIHGQKYNLENIHKDNYLEL